MNPLSSAVVRDGTIRLAPDGAGNPSGVVVGGPGGGPIQIEGGGVTLDVANVGTLNFGDIDDIGGVDLAADTLSIRGQTTAGGRAGGIVTTTFAAGRAGPVQVEATSITLDQGIIASTPLGAGGGGPITVAADHIAMHGGLIGVPLFGNAGFGASADTTVTATSSLTMDNGAGILSISGGDQGAGVITVGSQGAVNLAQGSLISTPAFASGAGGPIEIDAASLVLDSGQCGLGQCVRSRRRRHGADLRLAAPRPGPDRQQCRRRGQWRRPLHYYWYP